LTAPPLDCTLRSARAEDRATLESDPSAFLALRTGGRGRAIRPGFGSPLRVQPQCAKLNPPRRTTPEFAGQLRA
jgi:hypothetical protein